MSNAHDLIGARAEPDRDALDGQARDWVCLLASGRATAGDARRLKRWCARSAAHQAAFARARVQWHDAGRAADIHRRLYGRQDAAEAAQASRAAVRSPSRRRWMLVSGLSMAGAAAAGAAVAFPPMGLWPSWRELAADYRTGPGEQRRIALSPHIELTLNTRTSLAVQAVDGGERVQLISGEAAVRRTPGGEALELLAGEARILPAAGSSVEVRQSGERYCLTCAQGQAELRHMAHTVTLRAGERVWYGPAGVTEVAAVDIEQALAWHRGVVAFQATPLDEAVAEINRYREGRVVLADPALAQRRLSGHFRIDALDEALTQIEQVFGADVTRLPGGVVVLS